MEPILYYLPLLFPFLLLVMSITLLVKAKRQQVRKIIALLQLIGAVALVTNWFFTTNQLFVFKFLYGLLIACLLWIIPMLFWYLKRFLVPTVRMLIWHFVPALMMGIVITLYLLLLVNTTDSDLFFTFLKTNAPVVGAHLQLLGAIQSIAILFAGLQLVFYGFILHNITKSYQIEAKKEYGNIDRFKIFWVRDSFAFLAFLYLVTVFKQLFMPSSFAWYGDVCMVVFAAIILFIGIKGCLQRYPNLIKNQELFCDTDKDEEQEALNKLLHLFRTEQPFFNEDVNITDLCKQIDVDRNYMVSVIQIHMKMDFYTFVHRHRVNYLKKYKIDHPFVKPDEMMRIVGFSSIKEFNDALKRL